MIYNRIAITDIRGYNASYQYQFYTFQTGKHNIEWSGGFDDPLIRLNKPLLSITSDIVITLNDLHIEYLILYFRYPKAY